MRRLVLLSPHYDDAVCSVGAAIAARVDAGGDVVVVTVCGRVTDGARAAADRRACAILGAQAIHLDVADAPLRGYEVSYAGLCGVPDDVAVAPVMRQALASVVADDDEVWAPLGVGGHVDHRALFDAVAQRSDLVLYEDRPYARARGAVFARWHCIGAAPVVAPVVAAISSDDDDEDDVVAFLDAVGAPRPACDAARPPYAVSWGGRRYRRVALAVAAAHRRRRFDAICAYGGDAALLLGSALSDPRSRGWPWTDRAERLWIADDGDADHRRTEHP